MSAIVDPSAAAASTSRSRSVSGFGPADRAAAARAGSTTRSPASTRRIAAASSSTGPSLTRNPLAPASMARRRYPGRPNVVRISNLQPRSRGRRAAAVVDDLRVRAAAVPADLDPARTRTAVPDHVGDPLPYRPGQQRVHRRRQRLPAALYGRLDAGVAQAGPGPVQFLGQATGAV